jgi:phosphatidylglycerophosphate synthase
MLTAIGMIGAFMVFAGYIASNLGDQWLWCAIAGYAVQWFGDSTDGSLARWRKIERPRYGYFLDHSCDGLATTLVVVGIGFTPHVAMEFALIALAGYLLLSIHAFLSVRVLGEPKLSYMNAGPTELRFILITSAAELRRWPAASDATPARLADGSEIAIKVVATTKPKCVRCWHHRADVGSHSEHPELCGRCVSNVSGSGEVRRFG